MAEKHAGGRPTDYTPELVGKAREYITSFYGDVTDGVPSIANMAYILGISRSTIYKWSKDYSEFSDMLEEVLELQEHRLLYNGLNNKWNPTITKLMLSKHGYRDSSDITSDGKAIPTPILGGVTKDE